MYATMSHLHPLLAPLQKKLPTCQQVLTTTRQQCKDILFRILSQLHEGAQRTAELSHLLEFYLHDAFPNRQKYKEHARTLFTFLDTPGFQISKYWIIGLAERLADIETVSRQMLYDSHHLHHAGYYN